MIQSASARAGGPAQAHRLGSVLGHSTPRSRAMSDVGRGARLRKPTEAGEALQQQQASKSAKAAAREQSPGAPQMGRPPGSGIGSKRGNQYSKSTAKRQQMQSLGSLGGKRKALHAWLLGHTQSPGGHKFMMQLAEAVRTSDVAATLSTLRSLANSLQISYGDVLNELTEHFEFDYSNVPDDSSDDDYPSSEEDTEAGDAPSTTAGAEVQTTEAGAQAQTTAARRGRSPSRSAQASSSRMRSRGSSTESLVGRQQRSASPAGSVSYSSSRGNYKASHEVGRRQLANRQQRFNLVAGSYQLFLKHLAALFAEKPHDALMLITDELVLPRLQEALQHSNQGTKSSLHQLTNTSSLHASAALALAMQLSLSQARYHMLRMLLPRGIVPPKSQILAERARLCPEGCLQPLHLPSGSSGAQGEQVGWFIADIVALVLQPELEAYFQRYPSASMVAVKFGMDNFQVINHAGTVKRFIEQASMVVIWPGEGNNAVAGADYRARVLAIAQGKEHEALVRCMVEAVVSQLPEALMVGGEMRSIQWQLAGDFKMACCELGLQGQCALFPCTWCVETKAQMGSRISAKQKQPLRSAEMCASVGHIVQGHLQATKEGLLKVASLPALKADATLAQAMRSTCNNCGGRFQPPVATPRCCASPVVCLAPHEPVSLQAFNDFRKSVARPCMSPLFTISSYRIEVLHLHLNIINNQFSLCVKAAAQLGKDLLAVMKEQLGLPRPITM